MPTLKQLLASKSFKAHSAPRQLSLEGRRLASFQRRAIAMAADLVIFNLAAIAVNLLWRMAHSNWRSATGVKVVGLDTWWALAIVVVYFGTLTYLGHGQTPGKRLLGIRVVSLVHDRISLWQSIERALGYAASSLELGFGFLQYFIHPNAQTVHDRIAETIVISENTVP
ncbi:MAG TPA: RDD family protein [Rhodanobacter sp.]